MKYQEAIKVWGAQKLESAGYENVDTESVQVRFDVSEGYACCGGRDPDCYCSYAESPRFDVVIEGVTDYLYIGTTVRATADYRLDLKDLDFGDLIREVVEAGNGAGALTA